MAVNFTFGQDIASSLDRTFSRGQQSRQFALNLARRLKQDAFNNQIRRLSARMAQKRQQLAQEKFEYNMVQDAIDRQRQEEIDELNERLTEAQIKNKESLIEARKKKDGKDKVNQGEDGKDNVNQGAVSIELQALTNELRNDREKLGSLRNAQQQVFDTGVVPSDLAGEFGQANPTDVLFSLTSQILRQQKEIERKEERAQFLRELAGTATPEEEQEEQGEQEGASRQQKPINSSVFE